MLDSWHMESCKFRGESARFPLNRFCHAVQRFCPGLIGKLGLSVLIFSFSSAAIAQQMQQGTQGQGADCSDPMNVSDQQCQANSQPLSPLPQNSNVPGQTTLRPQSSGTYTDNESFLRGMNAGEGRRPLAPEPLTEFQKFVATTTGVVLPIYGEELFRNVPSTFAPLQMTPVPSDFLVGPGDEVRIRVWGQVSFEANVRVDRSGDVYLPHIGPVHVAGLQFGQLDTHLRQAIARVYRNFDLTVDMGQIRSIQVYVAGQARRPGVYTVSSLSTLVDALFASGGPSVHGSLRNILLRRGNTVVADFDLYDLIVRGDKSKDVKLLPGDVIYIPPAGPQVAVTGSVRMQAIYELRGKETLNDLFRDTGGITAVASSARISIERIQDHRDRQAMEVAYDKAGLSTHLEDGDIIHVNPIVPQYEKTVTLRGNIANPGRFAWHAGMRVSDLIPDKDSLITRNYWWRRAQQGLPAPEFEPASGWSNMGQPVYPTQIPVTGRGLPAPPTNTENQPYRQNGQSEREQGGLANAAPYGTRSGATGPGYEPLPQNTFGTEPPQQPAEEVDQNQPNQGSRTGGSSLASQQQRYGGYRGAVQPTEVSILAPEIDWDYAVIERLDPETLKTKLVPFDLGKLVLNHDPSQDIELKPGDVVTIFSEADIRLPLAQQTKMVKLEGEFAHAGSYTVKPGESLRQLVERAGGFTQAAYLYGSQFSRESTRKIQQERIDEYVQTVQMEMQRATMSMIAAGTATAGSNGQTAAQTSSQELISRLRQVRATGRIVLEFRPGSKGVDSLPNIALEDGDVFVVPSVPASVNVVGAVYNQNSFLYSHSRRVSDYMHMAGGPNRNSDYRHAFIIRADGEVVSRSAYHGAWDNSFDGLHLYPGDTIVVPDKTIKPPALRAITDWSTVFSQLALGVVYLRTLP